MEKVKKVIKRINQKLVKQFNEIVQINRESIKSGEEIPTACILTHKGGKSDLIELRFIDSQEKELMRSALLKHIANSKVLGYILVMDCKMTSFDPKGIKPTKVVDAIMTTLHTPNGSKMQCTQYEGKKITEEIDMTKQCKQIKSEWDIWGESMDYSDPETKKDDSRYQAYKKDNPKLFEGLA